MIIIYYLPAVSQYIWFNIYLIDDFHILQRGIIPINHYKSTILVEYSLYFLIHNASLPIILTIFNNLLTMVIYIYIIFKRFKPCFWGMSTWDMPCPIQAIQRDEPPGKARMPLEVRAKKMATNMGFYGKNDMNMGFHLGFSWRYGRWWQKKTWQSHGIPGNVIKFHGHVWGFNEDLVGI